MKKYFILISALTIIFYTTSCRKDGTPVCKPGQGGGNATLVVLPQHHGHAIPGCTAYVAYGTLSSPGSLSSYNLTVVGEAEEEHVHLEDMNCGDYFIFCTGYDSSISQTVRGGIPFTLDPLQTGEIDVIVPVTE